MQRELEQHNLDLLGELGKRLERAELALNRHGFTQAQSGDWTAPGNPNWAGALELRDHLTVHFPDIAAQSGTLNQKAIAALIESDQRRSDAASEWLRSAIPTLSGFGVKPTPSIAPVLPIQAMNIVDAAPEPEPEPEAHPAPPAAPRHVIWPEPGKITFILDRRDPMSYQERHTSLKRRSSDDD